jgi:hypothetical protein
MEHGMDRQLIRYVGLNGVPYAGARLVRIPLAPVGEGRVAGCRGAWEGDDTVGQPRPIPVLFVPVPIQ